MNHQKENVIKKAWIRYEKILKQASYTSYQYARQRRHIKSVLRYVERYKTSFENVDYLNDMETNTFQPSSKSKR